MKINRDMRLAAACRRLQFEVVKLFGIFWIIERIHWLKIKEPWNTLYRRR